MGERIGMARTTTPGRKLLALLVLLQIFQESFANKLFDVEMSPSFLTANPGDNVTLLCKGFKNGVLIDEKLDTCHFNIAKTGYSMKPGKQADGITYTGRGLETGDCGVVVHGIEEKHHGNISCSLTLDTNPTAQFGQMYLVVAVAPQKPELEVTVNTKDNTNHYREMDLLVATCTVRDGRPVANISWYLDDELVTEGLKMPVEVCTPQKRDLCTVQQNLNRTLQATDNKRILKCVAHHFSLPEGLVTEFKIIVNFSPKPSTGPFEHFGLMEGTLVKIPITVEANPKPLIFWSINGDIINENTENGRFSVLPTMPKGPGEYESVLIIDSLTKEDTEMEYVVTAHNDFGEGHYMVMLSTSMDSKVLEIGAGYIIFLIVCIIIVLLIIVGVLLIRAQGKFCLMDRAVKRDGTGFSDGADSPRATRESSDTESAEHTTDQRAKLAFVSVFKKKNDKVAADKNENPEQPADQKDYSDSVVYAELDLGSHQHQGPAVVVRGDDEKTEYAEIIHTQHPPKQ